MGTMSEFDLQCMVLVEPDVQYAAAFREMAEDFRAAGEPYYEDELPLIRRDFPAFVEHLRGYALGEGLPQGYIPADEFWLLDKLAEMIVGAIRLRHALTPYLLERGGNIGYTIRPRARRKGCGTHMLALLLQKLNDPAWQQAHRLHLDRVLVTCNVENTGSARIIESNGGVLENRVWSEGELISRYWIGLKHLENGHERD
jgi:predicted acetyltransferase